MAVRRAHAFSPRSLAISTMSLARSSARSSSGMNAPSPTFTSSSRPSSPSASFLLMMLAAMSGMEETVPVTSRRA